MGNRSNRDQWAGRERQMFIERLAWWRGSVNRSDVREMFGISAAQASADVQAYLEVNPGAMAYNLTTKRYEASPEMSCVLHVPSLEEATRVFLGEGAPLPFAQSTGGAKVDWIVPPARRAVPMVERRVFLAVSGRRRLRIRYWSMNSGEAADREIAPHALGHDGYRWHARAWCFKRGEFRDFTLSRMERADWPEEEFVPEAKDAAWTNQVTVVLRPHSNLDPIRRLAVERDYDMVGGRLEVSVREAMREYLLIQLRLHDRPVGDRQSPALLEVVE